MSEGSRRRVTYAQLDTLWEFLNDHRDIATGYNKSARARDNSKKMWETIAASLNAHGDGAVKDWKGWSKEPEERTQDIINETESNSLEVGVGSPILYEIEIQDDSTQPAMPGPSTRAVTPRPLSTQPAMPGPSTRAVTPRPLVRTPQTNTPRQSPRPSPRRSPRVHIPARQRAGSPPQRPRRRRREPPMSQEAARRALIEIAREGNEHLRAGLQEIKNEIRAVKELLQARLPVPELPPTPNLNLP